MTTLSILGAGRVGKTLACLWDQTQQIKIQAVLNSNIKSTEESIHFMRAGTAANELEGLLNADLLMISCSDDAIASNAKKIAQKLYKSHNKPICFHLSGCFSSEILLPLKQVGCSIASVHPLKSITEPSLAIHTFKGTYCTLEGDIEATKILSPLFESIGAHTLSIDAKDKAIYHAAFSMACNHLTGLLHISQEMLKKTSLPKDKINVILNNFITQTLTNIWAIGAPAALTGPIVRGDAKTVEMHLNALSHFPVEYKTVYKSLGRILIDITEKREGSCYKNLQTIKQKLQENQTLDRLSRKEYL